MASWTHQYCLVCDKQTDGATYCSESCKLAEYEKASSTTSSGASSPAFGGPSQPWSLKKQTSNTRFYLSPAYDFSNPQPTSSRMAPSYSSEGSQYSPNLILTPSTSQSSLYSIRSNSSADAEASQLSEKAARELRAYARSFESVRLQRRRSY